MNQIVLQLVLNRLLEELLKIISEEVAGEVSPEVFLRIYEQAVSVPYGILAIDFHPKKEHLSAYRRGIDTFIIVPEEK